MRILSNYCTLNKKNLCRFPQRNGIVSLVFSRIKRQFFSSLLLLLKTKNFIGEPNVFVVLLAYKRIVKRQEWFRVWRIFAELEGLLVSKMLSILNMENVKTDRKNGFRLCFLIN